MGAWGSVEFSELKKFEENFKKMNQKLVQKFIEDCAKELAARLLAKVIKRTPVGQYPKSSGKKGGTLRRGWTGGANATSYVQSLNVERVGTDYIIEIVNPTEYASYVEFGHRTVNHKGWVEGRFMLTVSVQEIEQIAPLLLERRLRTLLKGVFS